VLGKVIGGGLPAAAYAGPRRLMDLVAPAGTVYQAGTLSGNPLAVAAGLATLELLTDPAYHALDAVTRTLAEGIEAAARAAGVSVQVPWTTGLFTVFFADAPVTNFEEARACDTEAYAFFWRAMLERGGYPPACRAVAWFPALAHTSDHLERTFEAATVAFAAL